MKKSARRSDPPRHLSPEASALWSVVHERFALDPEDQLVLQTACEALMAMRAAQSVVDAEGIVIRDRFKQPKENPACRVVRDSRAQLLQAWRLLGLRDVAPPK